MTYAFRESTTTPNIKTDAKSDAILVIIFVQKVLVHTNNSLQVKEFDFEQINKIHCLGPVVVFSSSIQFM